MVQLHSYSLDLSMRHKMELEVVKADIPLTDTMVSGKESPDLLISNC